MELSNQVNPTNEQYKTLLATYPADTPISMLNIMRFKEHVDQKNQTGKEVYQTYLQKTTKYIKEVEGKLIWSGEVHGTFIGDDTQEPQMIFIVNYPTIEHFKRMIANPEYQEVAKLRTMSIEYGGLIAMSQQYLTK